MPSSAVGGLRRKRYAQERFEGVGIANVTPNGYLDVRQVDNPKAVAANLHEKGIDARHVYPVSIADQRGAAGVSIVIRSVSERAGHFCERVINLPLWYGMTSEDVERCSKAFEEAIQ